MSDSLVEQQKRTQHCKAIILSPSLPLKAQKLVKTTGTFTWKIYLALLFVLLDLIMPRKQLLLLTKIIYTIQEPEKLAQSDEAGMKPKEMISQV